MIVVVGLCIAQSIAEFTQHPSRNAIELSPFEVRRVVVWQKEKEETIKYTTKMMASRQTSALNK